MYKVVCSEATRGEKERPQEVAGKKKCSIVSQTVFPPQASGLMESSRPLLPPPLSGERITSPLQSDFSFHTGSSPARLLVVAPPLLPTPRARICARVCGRARCTGPSAGMKTLIEQETTSKLQIKNFIFFNHMYLKLRFLCTMLCYTWTARVMTLDTLNYI